MIVQVYEIQTADEVPHVVSAGVHRLGSVLTSMEHRRNPELKDAIARVRAAGRESSLIPLFSDLAAILEVIEYYRPHVIHFCEALTPFDNLMESCVPLVAIQEEVRAAFPDVGIMRSIPIPEPGSKMHVPTLELARIFEPVSDFFLTDTILDTDRTADIDDGQPVNGFVGITGRICNPDIARELVKMSRIPVVLAGGLSPDNVYELASRVMPAGVDSCTQTNAVDPATGRPVRFKKDIDKVSRFVKEAMRVSGMKDTS